jgi:hypothetical protein
VYNDKSLDGTRYAYGVSSDGSSFFIEMTTAEEAQFWQLFMTWRQGAPGDHAFSASSLVVLPPTCDTPNTPQCPPNELLNRKRNRLRDKLAGPGAGPDLLFAAEVRVTDLLVATLNAALDLIKPIKPL